MSALEVKCLRIEAVARSGEARLLVDNVSFSVPAASALAIVGESGSGKTLTLRAVLALLPHGVRAHAAFIRIGDTNLSDLSERSLAQIRGKRIGMVFQDAATALDPVMRVGAQIAEVTRAHLGVPRRRSHQIATEWLDRVGIADPEMAARKYPHELSGGQRQRVGIATALVSGPELLLCDEPTTALDVTIQAQILRLITELTTESGAGLVFVTHNLAVAAQVSDRVAVMRAGRIVESGDTAAVFAAPQDPYTRELLRAAPSLSGPATAAAQVVAATANASAHLEQT